MDNNIKTVVSSIRNTEWIDLSPGHKEIRELLEQHVHSACVEKSDTSPIMVKGAFGIGKTATLDYMFHYAWTKLLVPAFSINLEDLILLIEAYNKRNNYSKLPNKLVSEVVGEFIDEQLQTLKESNPSQIIGEQIAFPTFKEGNLQEYLVKFNKAKLHTTTNGEFSDSELPLFDNDTIKKSVNSNHRCLLFIDEFETKYHVLRELLESSGGGPLRQFFDDVSYISSTNYYVIIGNGPASGYEIGGYAAEQRRIIIRQLQMPTVNVLKKSFLAEYEKEYINLFWWLSRARPGQIKSLKKSSLRDYESNKEYNYIQFIRANEEVFKKDIDDTGEANVKFLKSEIFTDYNSEIQQQIKESLICLAPRRLNIQDENTKDLLLQGKSLFSTSEKRLPYNEIIDALKEDFSKQDLYLKIEAEKIYGYMDLILDAISDKETKVTFGCLDRSTEKSFAESFLNPLWSLLYDMISIYEDENDDDIKLLLDFLLAQNKHTEKIENVDRIYRKTYGLFEDNLQRKDEIYIQLNLNTIREAIEQPIGSPKIPYKSEPLETMISDVTEINNIFIWKKADKEEIIFIPDYADETLLGSYLASLKQYIIDNWDKGKNYSTDGELSSCVLYTIESEHISEFKKWLCFLEDDKEELAYRLKRIDVISIDQFNIHNTQRISDFLSSILKIATIGLSNGDIKLDQLLKSADTENIEAQLQSIIDIVLDASWTESKQIRRTIEYYRDLLLIGENSALYSISRTINEKYMAQLIDIIPIIPSIRNELINISINDNSFLKAYSSPSKNLFNLYLIEDFENSENDKAFVNILRSCRNFKFTPADRDTEMSLLCLFYSIEKNNNLPTLKQDYTEPPIAKQLSRFAEIIAEHISIDSLEDIISILEENTTVISTYSKKLGFYDSNIAYLNGFFFKALIKKLDSEVEKEQLLDKLKSLQKKFDLLFTDLTDSLYDLKELTLTENELNYNSEIRNYNTFIINPLIALLESKPTVSLLISAKIIIGHLNTTLENSEAFKIQILSITQKLNGHKEKIIEKQNEFDAIYNKSIIHNRLISKNKTEDFFYKKKYVSSFKAHNSFNMLFDDVNKFKPSDKHCIDENQLNLFTSNLDASYQKKIIEIIEDLNEAKEIDSKIGNALNLENSIKELIQTSNDE